MTACINFFLLIMHVYFISSYHAKSHASYTQPSSYTLVALNGSYRSFIYLEDKMRNTGSTAGSLWKDCGIAAERLRTLWKLWRDCGHIAARARNKCSSAVDAGSECTPGPPR